MFLLKKSKKEKEKWEGTEEEREEARTIVWTARVADPRRAAASSAGRKIPAVNLLKKLKEAKKVPSNGRGRGRGRGGMTHI